MTGITTKISLRRSLLPNLEANSVIVIDNAPYHSVMQENIPTKSTRKAAIQAWLASKGITWSSDILKAELLSIVSNVRFQYELYQIDNLAAHTVICLPLYHCELNLIELTWSHVKDYIASNNTTFKEDEEMQLTHEAIDNITPKLWGKEVKHVLNIEE
ncbi:hypothetical protein JTE90_008280 [Oedothorax gibbosus]|uniref:Tc1-like transposase DDE domain-containing protein n=1 Tax=Oedothorax gibbosus TaxID=931172 RepID=A0AAV6UI14_9ARAC|nr:hypothetical protein JTE90_008280 [Oedothorax gibbosus]